VNTAKPETSLHLVDPKANDAVDFEGDQGLARIAFSPDSKWLFGIHDNGTVYRWHLPSDDQITDNIVLAHDRVLTKVPWENTGLVFSPDSQWVIASDRQHYLYSWKVSERPYLGSPLAQQDDKGTILWTQNGKSLMSFGGSFVYYGTPDRPLRQIFRAPTPVMDIARSPDKKQFILFCRNQLISLKREIRLWGFIRLRRLEWDDLESHSY
jgi:WD40 repeat protein